MRSPLLWFQGVQTAVNVQRSQHRLVGISLLSSNIAENGRKDSDGPKWRIWAFKMIENELLLGRGKSIVTGIEMEASLRRRVP